MRYVQLRAFHYVAIIVDVELGRFALAEIGTRMFGTDTERLEDGMRHTWLLVVRRPPAPWMK